MHNRRRLLGFVLLCLAPIMACSRERAASPGSLLPFAKKDSYVGDWANLKNSSERLSIRSEGDAYVVEDESGKKFVGTKANGVLRLSGPMGAIDVLYAESSDRLIAAGDEYERFDPRVIAQLKLGEAEVRQTVVDEAKSAGTHDDDRIRSAILAKARENNLPVTEQDVNIVRTSNNSMITVTVEYTVPVTLPSGRVSEWHFRRYAENPIF